MENANGLRRVYPERIMFDDNERSAVLRLMDKAQRVSTPLALDRYGPGDSEVDLFEKEFAAYFGVKYASAVSSGTAAIHSALGALQLNPGAEIITSPITDPGTVAPILFQNCVPVFADVDYETMNIDPESLEKRITAKTKAVIVVHLAGQPAEMDRIMKIAREKNITVIEDCAQSIGSKYNGKYTGTMGDMSCFSLMSGKHITTAGQGGMVITDNEDLYWNVKRFADRGKPFNTDQKTNLFLGLNYRMTQLQATIGREQLKKLDSIIERREKLFSMIKEGCRDLKSIHVWKTIPEAEVNPWFIFARYHSEEMSLDKVQFAAKLAERGIPAGAHYTTPINEAIWIKEMHSYGDSKYPWMGNENNVQDYANSCPAAVKGIEDHITIYMHENWQEEDVDFMIRCIKEIEAECGR